MSNIEELVKAFNALPRGPLVPSGVFPNEWHFDVRYIPPLGKELPSHVLYICHPKLAFTYVGRLPLDGPAADSLSFFPESVDDIAPEVAKGLLFAFIHNLGERRVWSLRGAKASAPWKLTSEDRALAPAVARELKKIGVTAPELHEILLTPKGTYDEAHFAFEDMFNDVKRTCGLRGADYDCILTPWSVSFHDLRPPARRPFSLETADGRLKLRLEYITRVERARPRTRTNLDLHAFLAHNAQGLLDALIVQHTDRPAHVAKVVAEAGEAEAALDYGTRLLVGLDTALDIRLARHYLARAAMAPDAPDIIRAIAHGQMVSTYTVTGDGNLRARYSLAASFHSNAAAVLTRKIDPKLVICENVVDFLKMISDLRGPHVEQMNFFLKDARKARDVRGTAAAAQRRGAVAGPSRRRLTCPVPHRCAASGCKNEASPGTRLARCSGPCDADMKPGYCSTQCQKADWKNHKTFCRPGAGCSVFAED
ncbi:hypothetical protein HYPSUDRAFT_55688 [Hypholoma sublateritium FD-334 SS-4]|uniref:MYND-type domain-containing protein n=1 Tax=Hypholoma sublateritium (strain FD-334 SS-4) TaxID=945553 RepID=A0A0D2NQG4_HYPSF|nr:hypothetical protein HYPSUDRAFT_55688 [Hypholoma sublateritium FD-334 SS-4]